MTTLICLKVIPGNLLSQVTEVNCLSPDGNLKNKDLLAAQCAMPRVRLSKGSYSAMLQLSFSLATDSTQLMR